MCRDMDKQIEAILFMKGEPVSVKELTGILDAQENDVNESLSALEARLTGGIRLQRNGERVTLATAPEMATVLEKLQKDELSKELSKAAAETLAIVLYRGPIAKSQIDYIRGVNSVFILRNLQIRGLVEKIENSDDKRISLYQPTFELLSHLGVSKKEDLPEYETVFKKVDEFITVDEEQLNDEYEGEE
jgi:segregation and condensation protein B